jgi:RimJ/RimL family protein N-acetyltransferase
MIEVRSYSALEPMRKGGVVAIRAFRSDDRRSFLEAVRCSSDQTLYRRFFYPKRNFTAEEVEHYFSVDFVNHVALVAVLEEGGRDTIVGGARYIAMDCEKAEIALLVVDRYQGQGIGALLLRHLAAIARAAGLRKLSAEVLAVNAPMLKVFEKSGLPSKISRLTEVVCVELSLS